MWTQQECLQQPQICAALERDRPENVVKISSNEFWPIEAKPGQSLLSVACDEAMEYADKINSKSKGNAPVATGVAGDEETGFLVRHFIKVQDEWKPIKIGPRMLERFPSKAEIQRLVVNQTADLVREEPTQRDLVALANLINDQLHIAKVTKESRAILVAVLLIALREDPSLKMVDPVIFLDDINARAGRIFTNAGKQELWNNVSISYTKENAASIAASLEKIISALREADIVASIGESDVLGQFFEGFLRYGNTSKDLGIVLTPRQICWLAAEALDIRDSDYVYDPAAGTGGFLIAAFNRVRAQTDERRGKLFAERNIYGAEVGSNIAALAFVNMFFRGDGKHNLSFRSCFSMGIVRSGSNRLKFVEKSAVGKTGTAKAGVNRVLMNPPFSLKDSKEKEPDFIDHGLAQLVEGGLLFAILPGSVFYERKHFHWRKRLLEFNTLVSSGSLPIDVFYPVATQSIFVVLKKGKPHDFSRDVQWIRLEDDGLLKRKGFRVEKAGVTFRQALAKVAESLREWIIAGRKVNEEIGVIEFVPVRGGYDAELIPQAHLHTGNADPEAVARAAHNLIKGMVSQAWEQMANTAEFK